MKVDDNFVILFKAPKADEETDDYQRTLSDNGFIVRQIKTLDFAYKNLSVLYEKLKKPNGYNGIVFSSPRCVYGVQKALKDNDLPKDWQKKCNYVVGNGTYDAAIKSLNLKCDGKESGNANNLAEIMIKGKEFYNLDLPFLFPHGNLKMDLLKSKLSPEGMLLDEICVYDSITNDKLKDQFRDITNNFQTIPEIMVFFSPSAFKAALPAIKEIPEDFINNMKFVPIGPTTQAEIIAQNYQIFAVPEQPTPNAILNVMKSN